MRGCLYIHLYKYRETKTNYTYVWIATSTGWTPKLAPSSLQNLRPSGIVHHIDYRITQVWANSFQNSFQISFQISFQNSSQDSYKDSFQSSLQTLLHYIYHVISHYIALYITLFMQMSFWIIPSCILYIIYHSLFGKASWLVARLKPVSRMRNQKSRSRLRDLCASLLTPER